MGVNADGSESGERVIVTGMPQLTFLEFFAGGGLARLGLGDGWRCLFANDVDPKKCASYRANFGEADLVEADIATLRTRDLPQCAADLAWGSFPCQDLSLAGGRNGLAGARSGLFFEFLRLISALGAEGRAPRTIVIENVAGLLTSGGGADFERVVEDIAELGYLVSALVINASAFTPQSRPRLFVFGLRPGASNQFSHDPPTKLAPPALLRAAASLSPRAGKSWHWLSVPEFAANADASLADIVDMRSPDWSERDGRKALSLMSKGQRAALDEKAATGGAHVGAAFCRIRMEKGRKVQRLEARFDGLAGCLRTPAGGSSRQILLLVEGDKVKARRISPREAARLMGVPDSYVLPSGTTDALKLMGDGVAPPVVRWIADALLEPTLVRRLAAA